MKKRKKNSKGLLTPVHVIFFLIVVAVFLYSGVRYLFLEQSNTDVLPTILYETLPTLLFVIIGWLVISMCLTRTVLRPVRTLKKNIVGLKGGVEAGEKILPLNARGELNELSDALEKQSEEMIELIKEVKAKSAVEAEDKTRLWVADKIYSNCQLFSKTLEGEGFGMDFLLKPIAGACSVFADALLLDNHTGFFAIGDIQGKGLRAALAAMKLKNELREGIFAGKPLGQITLDLNAMLYSFGIAAILFLGIFYAETGELKFVNMGQIPPIVTGVYTDFLCTREGTPLGLFEAISAGEESFLLHPGQMLAFCTKGIVLRENNLEVSQRIDLIKTVQNCASMPEMAAENVLKGAGGVEGQMGTLILRYTSIPMSAQQSSSFASELREDREELYRAFVIKARQGR